MRKHVNRLTPKNKYCLVEEEAAYFKNISFESRNFCGLPKIHKSKIMKHPVMIQYSVK